MLSPLLVLNFIPWTTWENMQCFRLRINIRYLQSHLASDPVKDLMRHIYNNRHWLRVEVLNITLPDSAQWRPSADQTPPEGIKIQSHWKYDMSKCLPGRRCKFCSPCSEYQPWEGGQHVGPLPGLPSPEDRTRVRWENQIGKTATRGVGKKPAPGQIFRNKA